MLTEEKDLLYITISLDQFKCLFGTGPFILGLQPFPTSQLS